MFWTQLQVSVKIKRDTGNLDEIGSALIAIDTLEEHMRQQMSRSSK